MNNQKYWEERAILKDKLLEKDIKKIEKKLLKLFKDTRKEVLNELKIIYADIEASEYEKHRIDKLLASINNALDNLYSNNEKEVNKGLADIYKEMDKQASIDLNNSFNTVNENLVRETLKTNWSGLSFSERIWEHRRSLAFTIKSELNKGLIRGESLQDISRIISDKFDTSFSNAMRLVRTESCWVMNEVTVNNYKNNGIKEYEFMAFLDSKTSKECKRLDGKKFSIEEYQAGVNLPPLHPNCRSCIVPIVEDIKKPIKEAKKEIKESKTTKTSKTKVSKTKKEASKTNTNKPKLPKFKKPSSYKRIWGSDMHEKHLDWFNALTDKEKDDINKYTQQGVYDKLNTGLRKGNLRDLYKPLSDSLSKILQKNELKVNMQTYRGSSASIFKGLLDENTYNLMRENKADIETLKEKLLGNIVNDKGFMSTTISEEVVLNQDNGFLKNVLFKIDIDKKSTGVAFISPLSEFEIEAELLLDKNTSLYIKDIIFNKDRGLYEVNCHYLGQL